MFFLEELGDICYGRFKGIQFGPITLEMSCDTMQSTIKLSIEMCRFVVTVELLLQTLFLLTVSDICGCIRMLSYVCDQLIVDTAHDIGPPTRYTGEIHQVEEVR